MQLYRSVGIAMGLKIAKFAIYGYDMCGFGSMTQAVA
jgi:hypothetical protein